MDGISLGILFGLIAMLGYGLSNAMSQLPVKKFGSIKTIFYRNISVSLVLLTVLLFFLKETGFSFIYILMTIGISLIGYAALFSFYKALGVGKVGLISPIANSSVIFTVLFSIIFFRESLTIFQLVSIFLIILGIILISINFKDLKNSSLFQISSGIPFALITCFLWGLGFALVKIPVMVLGPFLTSLIIEFGLLIYSGINLRTIKTSFKIDFRSLSFIFLIGILASAGTLFFNWGIKIAPVSIVAALTFSNPLIATLYGKFIYKDKLRTVQWLAICFILIGVVIISSF